MNLKKPMDGFVDLPLKLVQRLNLDRVRRYYQHLPLIYEIEATKILALMVVNVLTRHLAKNNAIQINIKK